MAISWWITCRLGVFAVAFTVMLFDTLSCSLAAGAAAIADASLRAADLDSGSLLLACTSGVAGNDFSMLLQGFSAKKVQVAPVNREDVAKRQPWLHVTGSRGAWPEIHPQVERQTIHRSGASTIQQAARLAHADGGMPDGSFASGSAVRADFQMLYHARRVVTREGVPGAALIQIRRDNLSHPGHARDKDANETLARAATAAESADSSDVMHEHLIDNSSASDHSGNSTMHLALQNMTFSMSTTACFDRLDSLKCADWARQGFCDPPYGYEDLPVGSHWCRKSCEQCAGGSSGSGGGGAIGLGGSHGGSGSGSAPGGTSPGGGSVVAGGGIGGGHSIPSSGGAGGSSSSSGSSRNRITASVLGC
mmetsp:Transcript_143670/g.364687  ORF Transcript_143670/g.364687 Transcript_143670/m.364687 type:complete len:364 (-) Transcript_143670:2621-3712(-)